MPPKRKRVASAQAKGLLPGEQLKRSAIPGPSTWSWVGTEITDSANIAPEHRLAACHLSWRSSTPFCANKYSTGEIYANGTSNSNKTLPLTSVTGELEEDIIIISDDEQPSCSKKECKANPWCLNYVGQEVWEDEDKAKERFLDSARLGADPSEESREMVLPVGLKNLGATCYANASLQVWYRDLAFRAGVYSCEPPEGMTEETYQDSPIFQLQVTFAALQEGNGSAFNPKKLVESLQLRTSEQQDAQEFSKLFMSHLDTEFKKQSSLSTKTLITDQFQGTQVYGTICHSCKNRSERSSDFLEIEISFERNSKLEDRLAASLLPETLSGENKYFCSRCESLQDATRYTELRQLPPVLHISLLRFVYDIDTMERKKSKHSISFPQVLDMGKFVGSKNVRETATTKNGDNLYELRGVLVHKGGSAYHGHYEAQVHDAETGSWFQFNDETVTEIETLGDKGPTKKPTNLSGERDEVKNGPDASQIIKNRANARKRRRIDDSDDEVTESNKKCTANDSPNSADTFHQITSTDAYMLIYAKKSVMRYTSQSSASNDCHMAVQVPSPPVRAMNLIRELNHEHDKACNDYDSKAKQATVRFTKLTQDVKGIYTNWIVNRRSDFLIISRQALEAWLSDHCIEAALKSHNEEHPSLDSPHIDFRPIVIPIDDVICEHGCLHPMKWKDMKYIPLPTVLQIEKETNCSFQPILKPSDVCVACTSSIFEEKLYEIEHPKLVKQFEDIFFCSEDGLGYWVSKKWLRDWKLNKPRMHTPSQADPAPDSTDFSDQIYCEHGGLSLNVTNRRKISLAAVQLLQRLFPSWKPLDSETETCPVCDAEVHMSKEDKKEHRKRVEHEKALLKFIYEPTLDSRWNIDIGPGPTCYAVVPSHFIKAWKRWLSNPCVNTRPETVDNAQFLCEHHLLNFDPNCPIDLDSTIVMIRRDQWNVLQTIYDGGPLLALTKRSKDEGGGFDHEISVCEDCRMKRKVDWETADITIRLCKSDTPHTTTPALQKPMTYGRTTKGARQSRRLRHIKVHEERRRVTICKTTTVKDLKIMASEEFCIPTICQRMFYQGIELVDNTTTTSKLQLMANDVIDLQEAKEADEIHESDSEENHPGKRRREEGFGFGGTLLGNVDSPWSSSPEPAPPSSSIPDPEEKPCLACTFSNEPGALACAMCDTQFI